MMILYFKRKNILKICKKNYNINFGDKYENRKNKKTK